MKPLADCKLYTFMDTAYLHGRAPELVAQQLCDGGSDLAAGAQRVCVVSAILNSPDLTKACAEFRRKLG